MRTPERPFDGEASGDGAPSYEWLDEWLCEYVDGTMDPSMEAVFEQYVEADPELKAHVERLRQTREMLCGCDTPETPSTDGKAEVYSQAEEDLLQAPPLYPDGTGRRSAARLGIASSIAVALVVGFLAGSMLVDPATLSPASSASTVEVHAPSQESVREEAPPQPRQSAPVLQSRASSFSVEESFVPHSPSAPTSTPDTIAASSTRPSLGER